MLHISTQKLIEKLLERTQSGTIDWKERVPDGVILETEGYIVELIPNPANLRLLQANGRLLEDVSLTELESTRNAADRTFADIVHELSIEANRFARGTEQAIASILDAVESNSKPIIKSSPAFLGQPKYVTNPVSKPDGEETRPVKIPFSGTDIDPYSEAGMSAAVGKMVAEINGEPAGDELDEIESSDTSVSDTPTSNSSPTNSDDQNSETKTETELATIDESQEYVVLAKPPTEISDTVPAIEDEEENLEFKTHVVNTPSPIVHEAVPATATVTTQDSIADAEVIADSEIHETQLELPADILEDDLPSPPEVPDLPALETELLPDEDKIPTIETPNKYYANIITEDEELIPPPPLDLPPSILMSKPLERPSTDTIPVEDLDEQEQETLQDVELPTPEVVILDEDESNTILPDFDLPEIEQLPEVELDSIPEIIPETTPEIQTTDVEKDLISTKIIAEIPAVETPSVEILDEDSAKPPVTDEDRSKITPPTQLGYSFRNKVTATGLTINGNIGTLISGVPEDIRLRADEHERITRLQREKIEAEERAAKARKAADDAANARKSSIGFKSWS